MDQDKTTIFDLARSLGDNRPEGSVQREACLITISGVEAGRVHWLTDDEYTVGRGDDANICLEDDGISRAHAQLRRLESQEFVLTDLGSSNGTFCNNEPVINKILQEGDKLHLGTHTVLQFGYRDELEKEFLTRQYEAATRDALTECYNKKYFLDRLNSEHAFAERHATLLAVAMLDVDHFKAVNDSCGHQAGDHVLKGIADVMRAQLRTEDVLARFGGEEFVLLMRNTNLDAAKVVAERIRSAVESAAYRSGGQTISVTISCGIATAGPDAQMSPEAMLEAADEALYRAKRGGRNRTEYAG